MLPVYALEALSREIWSGQVLKLVHAPTGTWRDYMALPASQRLPLKNLVSLALAGTSMQARSPGNQLQSASSMSCGTASPCL